MNFVLVGEMGAGKDEAALCMPKYIRLAFGDEIRTVAKLLRVNIFDAYDYMYDLFDGHAPARMFDKLKELAKIPYDKPKDRKMLQELGTWAREHDDLIWVRAALAKIKPENNYVITDCRRMVELQACVDIGFVPVFIDTKEDIRKQRIIDRDGKWSDEDTKHKAESEIQVVRNGCSWHLKNNGTKEELKQEIEYMVNSYRT